MKLKAETREYTISRIHVNIDDMGTEHFNQRTLKIEF
jgi:hypothetical protein